MELWITGTTSTPRIDPPERIDCGPYPPQDTSLRSLIAGHMRKRDVSHAFFVFSNEDEHELEKVAGHHIDERGRGRVEEYLLHILDLILDHPWNVGSHVSYIRLGEAASNDSDELYLAITLKKAA